MSLINCPECGHEVSDKAASCPSCGMPLLNEQAEIRKRPVVEKNSGDGKDNRGMALPTIRTILIISALLLTASYPLIGFIAGGLVLLLIVCLKVEQTKAFAWKTLGINPSKRFISGFAVFCYFIYSTTLLLAAFGGHHTIAEQARVETEIRQAEIKRNAKLAERRDAANARVQELVENARELWSTGQRAEASRVIKRAEGLMYATQFDELKDLKTEFAVAAAEATYVRASSLAENGSFEEASILLQDILNDNRVSDKQNAENLSKWLSFMLDEKELEDFLFNLEDTLYEFLKTNHSLPAKLQSGIAAIDSKLLDLSMQLIPQLDGKRQQHKLEEEKATKLNSAVSDFLATGVNRKVPYHLWPLLGNPIGLIGTDGTYWAAYLPGGNISFISTKADDRVIFVGKGRSAMHELPKIKENRKKQIEAQFSAWDGSHQNLTRYIKQVMNDPKSYEHVQTTYSDFGSHLVVKTQFRGKNAFGGVVLDMVKAKIALDGTILEIVE
jgi:hypothetical protein